MMQCKSFQLLVFHKKSILHERHAYLQEMIIIVLELFRLSIALYDSKVDYNINGI
jgi:hypothetical protein